MAPEQGLVIVSKIVDVHIYKMANAHTPETVDGGDLLLDFTAGPFVTRRDPVREVIGSFSSLYINDTDHTPPNKENDDDDGGDAFPPPPPGSESLPLIAALYDRYDSLDSRVLSVENGLQSCSDVTGLSDRMAIIEDSLQSNVLSMNRDLKSMEEMLRYHIERECSKVKQSLELSVQDLGKTMVDCLRRRDAKIEAMIRASMPPITSTPVATHSQDAHFPNLPLREISKGDFNSSSYPVYHLKPPVKIEFPCFGDKECEADPISYTEKCEEFLAVRPLADAEILAALNSVLKGTAKDWWKAERSKVKNWVQFKAAFLKSFLSEDYEAEAERRIRERRQAPQESIRDFAFQFRALCLRWRSNISEKDVLQHILRNCNPRLASLLRGTVHTVDDLVRVGTLIEKDLQESKTYWSQVHKAEQKQSLTSPTQGGRKTSGGIGLCQSPRDQTSNQLTLPLLLRSYHCYALLDTGSTYSLIQESLWCRVKRPKEELNPGQDCAFVLANGQVHHALGYAEMKVILQGQEWKLDVYVMKDSHLAFPVVIGLDFLSLSGLILDFRRDCYALPCGNEVCSFSFNRQGSGTDSAAHMQLYLAIPIAPPPPPGTEDLIANLVERADTSEPIRKQLDDLLHEWPSVCTDSLGHTTVATHRIITTDEVPIRKKAYRVSKEKQDFLGAELKDMLSKGVIRPSSSPWASPVVLVKKKDGGTRFCIDYRGINAKTHLDAYPMPQVQEILESLNGATVFSTIDLKSGYWQVGMDPDSIQKTAFATCHGLFEFLSLPFGLKNAAASFQRLMETVLENIKGKFCFVYIDDIVVYSQTEQQHLEHLRGVFARLHKAGLTVNLKKCNLLQPSVSFLGHMVSSEGIVTEAKKVEAVMSFPTPQTVKEVQRFLGMTGWYHRFIPQFADRSAPLNALKRKNAPWVWTTECQEAFDGLKSDLAHAPVLLAPDFHLPFKVQTDASDVGLGAVLTQEVDGMERVIAYASRLLNPAERNYSVSERECLAVVWSVEKWRQFLEGRHFEVITDHSALAWVFNHPKPNSRLVRWTIRLQEFDFHVTYRKGQYNVVPDALSRAPVGLTSQLMVYQVDKDHKCTLPVDWMDIAAAQQDDPETQGIMKDIQRGNQKLGRIAYVMENGFLFRAVPLKQGGQKLQLFIPSKMRAQFLRYFHDSPLSGHLGRLKTLLRLLEVAYWPEVRKNVWEYTRHCVTCQRYKPQMTKPSGHLQSTAIQEPGYMLGVDYMGPFTKSKRQNQYLLVVVDYCSKWVELFPLRQAKTPKLAAILIDEIFTRWGTPAYLVSDRGSQFTSHLLNRVCHQWGVVQKLTTAYHPQTNLTERINRTLKTMIASFVKNKHNTWDQWMPEFRYAINSAWQESTGFTPSEIALGRKLKGPLERLISKSPDPDQSAYSLLERQQSLLEQVKRNVSKAQEKQARYYNPRRQQVSFECNALVWVRDHPLSRGEAGYMAKLAPKWKGPARVLKKLGPVNYKVAFIDQPDNSDVFHVQNLKLYFGPSDPCLERGGICNPGSPRDE